MSVFSNIFNGMARGFAFGTFGLNPFWGGCWCNTNLLYYSPNPFMTGGFFPIMPQISMPIFDMTPPQSAYRGFDFSNMQFNVPSISDLMKYYNSRNEGEIGDTFTLSKKTEETTQSSKTETQKSTIKNPVKDDSHNISRLSNKDSTQYNNLINKYSEQYGVDPNFVKAVIKQESRFNPRATGISTKYGRARGLMQLMPDTAKQYGVTDLYNPEQNIKAGVQLLSDLSKQYNGNKKMILAAYNWGSGNLNKKGFENRPNETRDYINKVLGYYNEYSTA